MSDEQRVSPSADADDTELVAKSRSGDHQAFALLWQRHHNRAFAAARTLARTEAEDVVSEAFTAVWGQLQRGRGPSSDFRPYLLATVRNLAARTYKRNLRVVSRAEVEAAPVDETHEPIEREESVRNMVDAFNELPRRWQEVLLLALVREMPRAQIAAELQLSPNSTSQLLRRAKEGLRVAWLRQRVSLEGEGVHRHIAESLPRYIRGGWHCRKQAAIRRHLERCVNCRALVSKLCRENAVLAAVSLTLVPIIAIAVAQGPLTDGHTAGSGSALAAVGSLTRVRLHDSSRSIGNARSIGNLSLPRAELRGLHGYVRIPD
ncbi:RNA polymerase sigma factor [Leucobacter sp. NPDC058333]|uniref:RNA polymerase sigma factor n=1 Tax=Leucobacter sp. NPDC058333 TaxID=3346450 RepID=UPI00364AF02D